MEETQLVRGKALAMLRILTLSSFKGKVNCFTLILTFYYVEAINSEPIVLETITIWTSHPGPSMPGCVGCQPCAHKDSVFVQPGH